MDKENTYLLICAFDLLLATIVGRCGLNKSNVHDQLFGIIWICRVQSQNLLLCPIQWMDNIRVRL